MVKKPTLLPSTNEETVRIKARKTQLLSLFSRNEQNIGCNNNFTCKPCSHHILLPLWHYILLFHLFAFFLFCAFRFMADAVIVDHDTKKREREMYVISI